MTDSKHPIETRQELGILPVRNTVLFPEVTVPILVGREKSKQLVKALSGETSPLLGVIAQRTPEQDDPSLSELYSVGVSGRLLKVSEVGDDNLQLIIQGERRFRVVTPGKSAPYLTAQVEMIPDVPSADLEVEALGRSVKALAVNLIDLRADLPNELAAMVQGLSGPGRVADLITFGSNINVAEKQSILETASVKERLEKVATHLSREIEIARITKDIKEQVQGSVGKSQREYFLREQMKAIQKELGEEDERTVEFNELQEKIQKARMPAEALKEAEKELERLQRLPPHAAEYSTIRGYLDWLVDLPWSVSTTDHLEIPEARRILDEDHYDLEKAKERILEFLAVRKLKSDLKGPILCFVGPPGTGKTSLGKSIARALGRKFARISLGGIRDEAEIRGHRRTYVGAMPGRIIQGLRKAGSNNPLFILDEIDKVGTDFRGDPSSALLEVLDPEQNNSFSDHYLGVPFDLSKVLFITTANILDTVPPPLRDRMEVLELPGYTSEEKLQIARKFILPKQLNENGITSDHLTVSDDAIETVIHDYTREAGLRNLEREIATVCRKVARKVVEDRQTRMMIEKSNLGELLGPQKFFSDIAERTQQPGVGIGLAWTPSGGEVLFVESTRMKGGKSLKLTGRLGDVMKESAEAALSFIRANAEKYGIKADFFDKDDLHIHVPSGAIPKDGPSAGLTMAISLLSLLRDTPVRPEVAMTGEITLRGKVLPVGGIKEKILAAKRAGVKTILLPSHNEKDLVEVPESVRKDLTFKFVNTIDAAVEVALPIANMGRSANPGS
jgi:ATP-dependent Lon protease